MSYADAASHGPKQTAEDPSNIYSRAPRVGGVYHDESEGTASLIDVDSPHVTSVDSNFLNQKVKADTQAERIDREEAEKAETESRKKAAARAKGRRTVVSRNKSNPVVVGNALLITAVAAGLGAGAYSKHLAGQLSWRLVGTASGVVGAFGVVDYWVSKWLFQNKYPPK